MKKADKVLFDKAKERIEKSNLDDHSKEGIGVALELSGEACNGMTKDEKIETLTQAVFSLTLAVGSFMAQAPAHTEKCINDAIQAHVGNCVKLSSAKKPASPQCDSGDSLSFSFKDGVKAHGKSAVIIAAVLAVCLSLYGIARWQDSKTRAAIKEIFDSRMEQIDNAKLSLKTGD